MLFKSPVFDLLSLTASLLLYLHLTIIVFCNSSFSYFFHSAIHILPVPWHTPFNSSSNSFCLQLYCLSLSVLNQLLSASLLLIFIILPWLSLELAQCRNMSPCLLLPLLVTGCLLSLKSYVLIQPPVTSL